MSDLDFRQRHAIDHQLQAIRLGAVYGALAFAGLIAANLTGWLIAGGGQSPFAAGVLFAVAGAAFAYGNFTAVASGAKEPVIVTAMVLSILCGAASMAMFAVGAS